MGFEVHTSLAVNVAATGRWLAFEQTHIRVLGNVKLCETMPIESTHIDLNSSVLI